MPGQRECLAVETARRVRCGCGTCARCVRVHQGCTLPCPRAASRRPGSSKKASSFMSTPGRHSRRNPAESEKSVEFCCDAADRPRQTFSLSSFLKDENSVSE